MVKFNFIILLAIGLMAGCNSGEPHKGGKINESQQVVTSDSFPDPAAIDSFFRVKDSVISRSMGGKDKCTEWQRQILEVKEYSAVYGNFIRDNNSRNAEGSAHIILRGIPTGSSCQGLKIAYLEFIPVGKPLRKPQFILRKNGNAEIRLFYHEDRMDEIIHSLSTSKNIYCWIGMFPLGHVWGDIHISGNPVSWK